MIVVIFEALPRPGRKDAYLDAAARLRPLLEGFNGFVSIERFASLTEPDKVLSLSVWRDEQAVRQWRNVEMHRHIQAAGRDSIFADYRLRVAQVLRDYGMDNRWQAPPDSCRAHGSGERTVLDAYLDRHYLPAEQFAAACGISTDELFALVKDRLVPAPSYVVTGSAEVTSHVFGTLPAPGATDGSYFHPDHVEWVHRAKCVIAEAGYERAGDALKAMFATNFQIALGQLDRSVWRLHDSFDADGAPIEAGLRARIVAIWAHFLQGTYGLCVAHPDCEAAIARKEVLQEKLVALTDNGSTTSYPNDKAQQILDLIDAFAQSAMPFSPVDYTLSSRKRLVDDLRQRVVAATENRTDDAHAGARVTR